LDFMLNGSLLNGLLAISALLLGLAFPLSTLASPALLSVWLIKILGFFILSYLFYMGAVTRARAYGETVKAAFDLYRWDLLKQIGFQQLPKTRKAERELWNKISVQLIYGDHPDRGPLVDYTDAPKEQLPSAHCNPPGPALALSRGVSDCIEKRTSQVVLEIKNLDKEKVASHVVVIDQIPGGYDYL
jgi:hypothetical protein